MIGVDASCAGLEGDIGREGVVVAGEVGADAQLLEEAARLRQGAVRLLQLPVPLGMADQSPVPL